MSTSQEASGDVVVLEVCDGCVAGETMAALRKRCLVLAATLALQQRDAEIWTLNAGLAGVNEMSGNPCKDTCPRVAPVEALLAEAGQSAEPLGGPVAS